LDSGTVVENQAKLFFAYSLIAHIREGCTPAERKITAYIECVSQVSGISALSNVLSC